LPGCRFVVGPARVVKGVRPVVATNIRPDRRQTRREVHIDRRKSDVDVIERVVDGVRPDRVHDNADDRRPGRSVRQRREDE
jgi:hypothetical protein